MSEKKCPFEDFTVIGLGGVIALRAIKNMQLHCYAVGLRSEIDAVRSALVALHDAAEAKLDVVKKESA